MVQLYACTICRKKISADDNRIHCGDCGSEICGSCYLRKETSPFHKSSHANYMIAECSGSMYIRPPGPPIRKAQEANGTSKAAKPAAAAQKRDGLKRKHPDSDYPDRPAGAPQTHAIPPPKGTGTGYRKCARCKKHHQRCSGPTEDGWCQRCQKTDFVECDFNKAEPTKSTSSPRSPYEGPLTSPDSESPSSDSLQPVTRRRLLSRRNMPSYMFDE